MQNELLQLRRRQALKFQQHGLKDRIEIARFPQIVISGIQAGIAIRDRLCRRRHRRLNISGRFRPGIGVNVRTLLPVAEGREAKSDLRISALVGSTARGTR